METATITLDDDLQVTSTANQRNIIQYSHNAFAVSLVFPIRAYSTIGVNWQNGATTGYIPLVRNEDYVSESNYDVIMSIPQGLTLNAGSLRIWLVAKTLSGSTITRSELSQTITFNVVKSAYVTDAVISDLDIATQLEAEITALASRVEALEAE